MRKKYDEAEEMMDEDLRLGPKRFMNFFPGKLGDENNDGNTAENWR